MALVKAGGGITDLRGSISGNTFSRSRSGMTVRARTKPVQPHFSPHHVSKENFSLLVEAWINDLTDSHRSGWTIYANAIKYRNKLGKSVQLTGQLQFIRCNMTRQLIGVSYIDAGPSVLALAEKDPAIIISASSDTQKLKITFDSTLGWANEQGGYLVVFQSRPQKLTRNSYNGPWLFSAYFAGSSTEELTPPYEFDSVYPLNECGRIFLKFIFLRADGRASGPVYTNCIIEKEPVTCLADKPIDVLPCNDSTRWSVSNCTVINDPAHHLCSSMNNQSVKITVDKWAGIWGHVTLTYPQIQSFFDRIYQDPYVLFRFFVHEGSGDSSYTHIHYVRLFFGDTPFTSYFGNYVTSSDYLLPGWNLRVCAPLTWYTSGSPVWNNIKKVRVEILCSTSGKNPSISIDEIRVIPRPQKPVVLFSMDDGSLSQLDVATYLASKNIKCTFYIVPTWIGQPGKLTLANLQTMQAQGHLIANHTNTHPAWHLVGDAAFISDVNAAKSWLSQNGFTEGSRILAIPNGTEDWPANGKDILLGKVVDSVRLTYWPPGMNHIGVMPYRRDLIHIDSHDSVANALTSLSNCKIDSSQSLPFFHNSSLGGVYTWEQLQGYIDSLAVERDAGNILIKTPLDREVLPSGKETLDMREILNWYQLLEGVGLTAIDFGPGNDYGTLTPNVIWLPKGVTIAASESRIASAAAAGFPSAAGSIETFVRPSWNNDDGLDHYLFDTFGGSNRRFCLFKGSDGYTRLFTDDTDRGGFVFNWVANTLYHVVLNWGTNQLYINKVLVHTFSAVGLGLGASTLYIGDRYALTPYSWDGNLYYFISRSVALTLAEITQFYNYFTNQYP